MTSWTNTIKLGTKKAVNLFSLNSKNIVLIDVGCGKGKVLCVWNQIFPNVKKIIGIEYSIHLVEICKKNLCQLRALNVEVICGHASVIHLDIDCEVFLFYLYNPFDIKILIKFLNQISNKKAIVIYCNPVHSYTLLSKGFKEYFVHVGWHPSASYAIFSNFTSS